MAAEALSVPPVIQILLVDDHPTIREGLALLLQLEGIHTCCEADGCAQAQARLEECTPDLAVIDLSLSGESGLLLLPELRRRGVPALVYSMHEDAHHVQGAFAAGALGYVTKRELSEVLVKAIQEVAAGRRFASLNAARALAESAAGPTPEAMDSGLSTQERQVYHLMGQGEGTVEIAAAMGIRARTVESYYARILDKLGLDGMRELRRHAIAHFRQHNE